MGGLGNQLFQIFTTISYSIESRNSFKFLNIKTLGSGDTTIRNTYWENFLIKLTPFLLYDFPQLIRVSERGFRYNNIDTNELIGQNILLHGYFQSYKYFQKYYEIICKMIGLESMKTNIINKLQLSKEYLDNTISIHFRLGDYKKVSDFHPIATYEYYERSLQHIQNKHSDKKFTILFFCEEEDIETVLVSINKLSDKFPHYEFKRGGHELEDWEQMLLMSCCYHNIIANSSFSWWGAYFNSNKDKIVCYPSVWFGEVANIDTQDLCPTYWIKIYV